MVGKENRSNTVGQFLTTLRQETGLTQKQVADRLGLSNKTISRWETDRGLPDVELLGKVAALYGVTVDELLAGERMTGQSEVEKAKILAAKRDTTWKHFQRDSNILLVLAVVGMMIYFWIYYKVNVRTIDMSQRVEQLIHGMYLLAWLGAVGREGIRIWRELQGQLTNLSTENPQEQRQIKEMVRCGGKKLCAIVLIVVVGLLPFVLAREYRTYDKMMEVAKESYLEIGQKPMDEETADRMKEVFRIAMAVGSREEMVESLNGGSLMYVKTYIQYLPMSICIGLMLWEMGCLFLRLKDRKEGATEVKKSEFVHAGVLLAGVIFLLTMTYYVGAYLGNEKYPGRETYKNEETFDSYVESYFNTYDALREHSDAKMPWIWRGLTKIDPQYMDKAMPDDEAFDRYRGVSGFDYDNYTVYKNGNNMNWIDWMGQWNKMVFLSGSIMLVFFVSVQMIGRRKISKIMY